MNETTNDKIGSNPSFKKLEKELTGMVAFSKAVSFFERLGIRDDKISEATKQIPDIKRQLEEMINTLEKFNHHFSKLGWVAYEGLKFDLMMQAVTLAENGSIGEAENLLVEYYDEKIIKQKLMMMRFIPEFKPRERLLLKALEDFVAERYHACVPVILANIDGLVSDIEQKGFFAQGTNLTAWDSIAAHSSGLQELAQLFGKIRRKTTTETISIPYRHGILHGHDLGYDNKTVAVKAWAALFALRDWVIAIRKPKPEPETRSSLRETLQQIIETQEETKRLRNWKPRKFTIGKDVPANGQSGDYLEGTPERALAEFMELWARKNYGKMSQLLSSLHQHETVKKTAGWVREIFGGITLVSFQIVTIDDFASAVTIIETNVTYDDLAGTEQNKVFKIRLIHEGNNGKSVTRGNPTGEWKLLTDVTQ
ncbi:MAG: hypothetical protein H6667_24555 [Ardenticatenaceae bacterium]|nr:hypothetical protein [Ardenticatenaceae bacterium]MCB9444964.1 hypothetical protein [Ardenticatenaceae bacterium]